MRYLKFTDHTTGMVYMAAFSDMTDGTATDAILRHVVTHHYSVRFADTPIRSNVRAKYIRTLDHLFSI